MPGPDQQTTAEVDAVHNSGQSVDTPQSHRHLQFPDRHTGHATARIAMRLDHDGASSLTNTVPMILTVHRSVQVVVCSS